MGEDMATSWTRGILRAMVAHASLPGLCMSLQCICMCGNCAGESLRDWYMNRWQDKDLSSQYFTIQTFPPSAASWHACFSIFSLAGQLYGSAM